MTLPRPRVMLGMAHADLLERTRRPAFPVTLAIALWAASVFAPPNHGAYATMQIDGHRGLYNSAWIGALTAMLCSLFYSITGFYLVRSTVDFDRRSGVGALLGATPMGRVEYTLAKWLANFGLLAAMVAVMAVGALAMQFARGEDRSLDLLALITPFVWVTLPAMAVTAGVAVLFECVPALAGGGGNVAFFFLWIFGVGLPGSAVDAGLAVPDPLGIATLAGEMRRATVAAFPPGSLRADTYSVGLNFRTGGWDLVTFPWEGMRWTLGLILPRLGWLAGGAALAVLAALPFDRFSSAGAPARERRPRGAKAAAAAGNGAPFASAPPAPVPSAHLALPPVHPGAAWLGLYLAEWRLLLGGVPWIWYLVPLALVVTSAFVPAVAAGKVAGVAWAWPLLRWSALGARDATHGTAALLLSSPRPVGRQLAAAWAAGATLALACGAGLALRALFAGDWAGALTVLAGAAFVPAMALALGTATGSSKAFEVLYLVLWYAGPINAVPFLDYTGGSGSGAAAGFALAAAALLALAALARHRALAR